MKNNTLRENGHSFPALPAVKNKVQSDNLLLSASKLVCGRERGTNLHSSTMRVGLQIFCSTMFLTVCAAFFGG